MAFNTENGRTAGLMPEGLLSPSLRDSLLGDPNPALMLAADGRTVLWSSHEGARQFGYSSADAMMRVRLADTAPGTRKLAELASTGSGSGTRMERLRFFVGFRVVMLTVLCRSVQRMDGQGALIVSFPLSLRDTSTMPLLPGAMEIMPAPAGIETPENVADDRTVSDDTDAEHAANPLVPPDWLNLDVGARAPRRFVFTLDAEGRIESVSPPLAASVGSQNARTEGRTLQDVIREFDVAASERVAAAIGQGETWSGISVAWPVAETSLAIPVELAALPIIDAARGVQGFSGFGRCRIDHAYALGAEKMDAREAEAALPAPLGNNGANDNMTGADTPPAEMDKIAAQDALDAPVDRDAPNAEDASETHAPQYPENIQDIEGIEDTQGLEDTQAAESITSDNTSEEPEGNPESISEDDVPPRRPRSRLPEKPNVVSIRTGQPSLALPGFQRNGLSNSERNAFREIAKALGAKFEESDDAEPVIDKPETGTGRNDAFPLDALQANASLENNVTQPEPERPEAGNRHFPEPVQNGATSMIDRLPIGVLVLKGDLALFANRTLLDLTGYPDFRTFSQEKGAQAIFRKGAAPSVARDGFDTVVLATREDEMIPVDAHLQLVDWDGGKATLISIRRAAELEQGKALRSVALDLKRAQDIQAELRAVLDTATDGVITIDENGHILSLNGAAEALFDINQNEIVGAHLTRLLHNDSHASALDYIEGLRSHGVKSVLNDGRDVFGREKKGGRIPLFMTLGRINEGEPQRFCAVLRDMTAWKRAEAELTDARQTAERASAKKSDFLTKISHEIRTPMNAIIGFAELMQDEKLGALGHPKYKEYLSDIRTSGHHVVSLVNDLLDLAKIEAGRMEMSFVATDINAIVASCVGIIQPQATTARVLLRTQLVQDMPQVVADERSIRQIVLNMLSNATRFTGSGGQVLVSTSLLETGEAIIRIRDTGVGMTSGEIEQALEPFRQVGTQRNKGGTGLGLPLTRALAQANRANFSIRSTPGEGTLVEITFPSTRVLAE